MLQDHAEVRAVIPRRSSLLGDRGVLIVSYAMHKQKTLFFFLIQVFSLTWPVRMSFPIQSVLRLCSCVS